MIWFGAAFVVGAISALILMVAFAHAIIASNNPPQSRRHPWHFR